MSNDTPNKTPADQKKNGNNIHRADLHASPAHAELVETILAQLEVFFSGKMAGLFVTADEHLFQAADHAQSTADQNRLFEFMNALRKQREIIGKNFFSELNKYLRPVAVSKELPKKKHHAPAGQSGLSLIDQDEMDEMIALTTISGKAAMDYREELAHLEARLEHLALQNRNIFHPRALDPQHICDAFQEALVFSEYDKRNKLVLYKLFGSEVIKPVKQLYDDLNGLMIRAGILPQIEHTGKIRRHARDNRERAVPPPPDDEQFTAAQAQGPLGRGGQSHGYYSGGTSGAGGGAAGAGPGRAGGGTRGGAAGAGVGAGVGAGGGAGAGGAAGSGGGTGGGAAAGGYSGGQAGGGHPVTGQGQGPGGRQPGGAGNKTVAVASESADQRVSAGMSVGHIRQSISGYVGGDPVSGDAGGGGVDGALYYTRQEVVSALSGIQDTAEVTHDAPLKFDAGAIKKAVLASIGERSGGVVNKRVNQISEKTIDFIKLIFDAIIEDSGINDTIKALLLSLQIPIIKAAMLDADFFIDDKHPARQLLDRIAEAGVGVSDHKDAVYIELNGIVKTLLKEYHEDIGAFSTALAAIKALTDRIYEKARNTEKQSQEQVKHAHARSVVLQEIRKVTLGKELAPGIRVLVLKIWPSLMFNHYLRHGKANDEWVEMLMVLSKIIESVQSYLSITDLEELGLSYEDILHSVSDKLKKCNKPEAVLNQAIGDLRETYAKLDAQRAASAATQAATDAAKSAPAKPVADVIAITPATAKPKKPVTPIVADVADEKMPSVAAHAIETTPEVPAHTADQVSVADAEITPEKAARAKLDRLPSDVQPGSWFIVFNGEGRPVRRLKLAVILMQDATLVFVDHLGNVVVEKDAEEFAEELVRGASGIIMQHSVFDHALRSALQTIQH